VTQETAGDAGGKKVKKGLVLTPEQEEHLVEWYREHPLFYIKGLRDYKDTSKKDKLWAEYGKRLGVEGPEVSTWIKSMRTRYGKVVKMPSGSGTKEFSERDKWIMVKFGFLKSHIVCKHGRVGGSIKAQLQERPGTSAGTSARIPVQLQEEVQEEDDDLDDDMDNGQQLQMASTPMSYEMPPESPALSIISEGGGGGGIQLPPRTVPSSAMLPPSGASKRPRVGKKSPLPTSTGPSIASSIALRAANTTKLTEQIQRLVAVQSTPPPAPPNEQQIWCDWMSAITRDIHPDLWGRFHRESFDMMMWYKENSQHLAADPTFMPPQRIPLVTNPPPQQYQPSHLTSHLPMQQQMFPQQQQQQSAMHMTSQQLLYQPQVHPAQPAQPFQPFVSTSRPSSAPTFTTAGPVTTSVYTDMQPVQSGNVSIGSSFLKSMFGSYADESAPAVTLAAPLTTLAAATLQLLVPPPPPPHQVHSDATSTVTSVSVPPPAIVRQGSQEEEEEPVFP